MGAVITFLYSGTDQYQDDLNGLITSGIAISVKMNYVMKIKKKIISILAKTFPHMTLRTGLDINMISHDQSIIESYLNDPFFHDDISTYLGNFLLNSKEPVLMAANQIKIPVYMFHGKEDKIALYEGSIEAFQKLASKDKTLKIFEGLFHSPLNESPEKRKVVYAELIDWLSKH